jgi:glycerol-3-phosphate dehydrogenase
VIVDLLVVGGGINGAGIARDAAGRGFSVLLVERGDLAGATSSASSKLIHGGLRYLEFGEFRLVREALAEREVLMRLAPHLIHPAEFVLPHDRSLRPRWMLRLGLLLYDHLGGRERLPPSRRIDPRGDGLGAPLRPDIAAAFVYADCQVDDARLVIANTRDAARRGASVLRGAEFVSARRAGAAWRAELRMPDGTRSEVEARALVNAGGPWAMEIARRAGVEHGRAALRLVKGSHIVVPRLYGGAHAYMLQNDDRRIVFVLPFEQDFTLIGTTEAPFGGDPAQVAGTDAEVAYLCRAVSRWFAQPVLPAAVCWRYAGVRPLYEDHAENASAVTRDYVLLRDGDPPAAPMLSVLGGKITTYRRLAEHALERLGLAGTSGAWTAGAPLPGGALVGGSVETAAAVLRTAYPWLDAVVSDRLIRRYGDEAAVVLGDARRAEDLGHAFGAGLSAREVDWLRREEWAESADDILWRRTKLGLRFDAAGRARLEEYLARVPQLRARL